MFDQRPVPLRAERAGGNLRGDPRSDLPPTAIWCDSWRQPEQSRMAGLRSPGAIGNPGAKSRGAARSTYQPAAAHPYAVDRRRAVSGGSTEGIPGMPRLNPFDAMRLRLWRPACWQLALLAAVGIAVILAIAIVATSLILIVAPVVLVAVLAQRFLPRR